MLFDDIHIPRVNDLFFVLHPMNPISAAMLLHSDLVQPELREYASELTRQLITRGEEEEEQIRLERDPQILLSKLNRETDNICYLAAIV